MFKKNAFFILLCACLPVAVSAAVIHVPGEELTIQAGIDAASGGDTVLVADGTYTGAGNKNLNFYGKAIIVTAEGEPEDCVIDCKNNGRGFLFVSGEGVDSVVRGFTIQNGKIDHGGGIYCAGSSPEINGNVIRNNTGTMSSGGIYCVSGAQPLIRNNLIVDNNAGRQGGGGIECYYSNPTIQNNTLIGNGAGLVPDDTEWRDFYDPSGAAGLSGGGSEFSGRFGNDFDIYHPDHDPGEQMMSERDAVYGGGAISLFFCFPLILDNTIVNNAAHYGGGVFCFGASPRIEGSIMTGNKSIWGGALYYSGGASPKIRECEITGNQANRYGGGIYGWYSGGEIEITGCLISENRATDFGGGISCNHLWGRMIISGNTIIGNEVVRFGGGGIHCFDSYNHVTIENNFIAGNMAVVGGGLDCDHAHPNVRNNIFLENTADTYGGGICCFVGRPGIINCTFSGNSAGQFGGGVFCRLGSFATITNCILRGDLPEAIYVYHGAGPTVTYSNVQDGYPGEGNMDADPLFTDEGPFGSHYLCQIAAGQDETSPCVDAGDPGSDMIDGTTRSDSVQDEGVTDMGYHYPLTESF